MKIFEVEQPTNKFNPELRQRLRGRGNFPLSNKEKDAEFGDDDKLDMTAKQATARANTNSSSKTIKSLERFKTGNARADKFFDNFDNESKSKIESLGLKPVYVNESGKFYILVTTKNNVTIKIDGANNGVVWVKGLNKPEQKEAVYSAMEENGVDANPPRNDGWAGFVKTGESKLQSLPKMLGIIDSLGPDFKQGRSSRNTNARKYYSYLTENVISAWANDQSYAYRRGGTGNPFDEFDDLIAIGYTKEGWENTNKDREIEQSTGKQVDEKKSGTWREHVVPGKAITDMCLAICEKNLNKYRNRLDRAPEDLKKQNFMEVADCINRNLAIVIASKDEANYIDTNMGWKTTMPPGWKDGDNILARFTKCVGYPDKDSKGIPVYSNKGGKRIAENNKP